ncbi:MAG: hypothetical protein ACI4AQ_05745 [Lachnospiraceae bacterium]
MSEPTVAYPNSCNLLFLQAEAERMEKQIHNDIKKYRDEMSQELIEALQGLERACSVLSKQVEAERKDRNPQEGL